MLIDGQDGDVPDVARVDVEEVTDVLPQDLTREATLVFTLPRWRKPYHMTAAP